MNGDVRRDGENEQPLPVVRFHALDSSRRSVVVFSAVPHVVEFNRPSVVESGRNMQQADNQTRNGEDGDFDGQSI
jgi:hypothetical protein